MELCWVDFLWPEHFDQKNFDRNILGQHKFNTTRFPSWHIFFQLPFLLRLELECNQTRKSNSWLLVLKKESKVVLDYPPEKTRYVSNFVIWIWSLKSFQDPQISISCLNPVRIFELSVFTENVARLTWDLLLFICKFWLPTSVFLTGSKFIYLTIFP